MRFYVLLFPLFILGAFGCVTDNVFYSSQGDVFDIYLQMRISFTCTPHQCCVMEELYQNTKTISPELVVTMFITFCTYVLSHFLIGVDSILTRFLQVSLAIQFGVLMSGLHAIVGLLLQNMGWNHNTALSMSVLFVILGACVEAKYQGQTVLTSLLFYVYEACLKPQIRCFSLPHTSSRVDRVTYETNACTPTWATWFALKFLPGVAGAETVSNVTVPNVLFALPLFHTIWRPTFSSVVALAMSYTQNSVALHLWVYVVVYVMASTRTVDVQTLFERGIRELHPIDRLLDFPKRVLRYFFPLAMTHDEAVVHNASAWEAYLNSKRPWIPQVNVRDCWRKIGQSYKTFYEMGWDPVNNQVVHIGTYRRTYTWWERLCDDGFYGDANGAYRPAWRNVKYAQTYSRRHDPTNGHPYYRVIPQALHEVEDECTAGYTDVSGFFKRTFYGNFHVPNAPTMTFEKWRRRPASLCFELLAILTMSLVAIFCCNGKDINQQECSMACSYFFALMFIRILITSFYQVYEYRWVDTFMRFMNTRTYYVIWMTPIALQFLSQWCELHIYDAVRNTLGYSNNEMMIFTTVSFLSIVVLFSLSSRTSLRTRGRQWRPPTLVVAMAVFFIILTQHQAAAMNPIDAFFSHVQGYLFEPTYSYLYWIHPYHAGITYSNCLSFMVYHIILFHQNNTVSPSFRFSDTLLKNSILLPIFGFSWVFVLWQLVQYLPTMFRIRSLFAIGFAVFIPTYPHGAVSAIATIFPGLHQEAADLFIVPTVPYFSFIVWYLIDTNLCFLLSKAKPLIGSRVPKFLYNAIRYAIHDAEFFRSYIMKVISHGNIGSELIFYRRIAVSSIVRDPQGRIIGIANRTRQQIKLVSIGAHNLPIEAFPLWSPPASTVRSAMFWGSQIIEQRFCNDVPNNPVPPRVERVPRLPHLFKMILLTVMAFLTQTAVRYPKMTMLIVLAIMPAATQAQTIIDLAEILVNSGYMGYSPPMFDYAKLCATAALIFIFIYGVYSMCINFRQYWSRTLTLLLQTAIAFFWPEMAWYLVPISGLTISAVTWYFRLRPITDLVRSWCVFGLLDIGSAVLMHWYNPISLWHFFSNTYYNSVWILTVCCLFFIIMIDLYGSGFFSQRSVLIKDTRTDRVIARYYSDTLLGYLAYGSTVLTTPQAFRFTSERLAFTHDEVLDKYRAALDSNTLTKQLLKNAQHAGSMDSLVAFVNDSGNFPVELCANTLKATPFGSIARITTANSVGQGVHVGTASNPLFICNAHTVLDSGIAQKNVTVGKNTYRLASFSAESDLAIYRADGYQGPRANIGPLRPGDNYIWAGMNPDDETFAFVAHIGPNGSNTGIQGNYGDSGSVLFDLSGRVVAIKWASAVDDAKKPIPLNYFIPLQGLKHSHIPTEKPVAATSLMKVHDLEDITNPDEFLTKTLGIADEYAGEILTAHNSNDTAEVARLFKNLNQIISVGKGIEAQKRAAYKMEKVAHTVFQHSPEVLRLRSEISRKQDELTILHAQLDDYLLSDTDLTEVRERKLALQTELRALKDKEKAMIASKFGNKIDEIYKQMSDLGQEIGLVRKELAEATPETDLSAKKQNLKELYNRLAEMSRVNAVFQEDAMACRMPKELQRVRYPIVYKDDNLWYTHLADKKVLTSETHPAMDQTVMALGTEYGYPKHKLWRKALQTATTTKEQYELLTANVAPTSLGHFVRRICGILSPTRYQMSCPNCDFEFQCQDHHDIAHVCSSTCHKQLIAAYDVHSRTCKANKWISNTDFYVKGLRCGSRHGKLTQGTWQCPKDHTCVLTTTEFKDICGGPKFKLNKWYVVSGEDGPKLYVARDCFAYAMVRNITAHEFAVTNDSEPKPRMSSPPRREQQQQRGRSPARTAPVFTPKRTHDRECQCILCVPEQKVGQYCIWCSSGDHFTDACDMARKKQCSRCNSTIDLSQTWSSAKAAMERKSHASLCCEKAACTICGRTDHHALVCPILMRKNIFWSAKDKSPVISYDYRRSVTLPKGFQ